MAAATPPTLDPRSSEEQLERLVAAIAPWLLELPGWGRSAPLRSYATWILRAGNLQGETA
jgi:hypothetical protein